MKLIFHILIIIQSASIVYGQTIQELQQSTEWDLEMLQMDIHNLDEPQQGIMTMGAFPVKNYSGAAGVTDHHYQIGDREILGASYFIGKNEKIHHNYKEGDTHIAFFNILFLLPEGAIVPDDHTFDHVLSRNHPIYLGQGYIKTGRFPIEYLAFSDGLDKSFGIINMKIFELTLGNTILVSMESDRSLRFLQIEAPYMSISDASERIASLLALDEVTEFYNIQKGEAKKIVEPAPEKNYQDKRIEVAFTHTMTQSDLDKIKAEMLKENIQLEFINAKFNADGKLTSISFSVSTDDGYSGSASSMNVHLSPIGFYRDFRKGAKSSFGTGTPK